MRRKRGRGWYIKAFGSLIGAQHAEHGPVPHSSQRGVTAIARPPLLADLAVHTFDSVLVGSSGNSSASELRSPLGLASQSQGLPSSGYLLRSPTVCPFKLVCGLTPINGDGLQHELRHHSNPDKVAYEVQGLRDDSHLVFNYSTSLKSVYGEYGLGTSKPSGHRQLLAIGSSDRQSGGPLLSASPS